jgi:hypothetical protein
MPMASLRDARDESAVLQAPMPGLASMNSRGAATPPDPLWMPGIDVTTPRSRSAVAEPFAIVSARSTRRLRSPPVAQSSGLAVLGVQSS